MWVRMVTSLEEKPENCHVLKIHNPILTDLDMLKIKHLNKDGIQGATRYQSFIIRALL